MVSRFDNWKCIGEKYEKGVKGGVSFRRKKRERKNTNPNVSGKRHTKNYCCVVIAIDSDVGYSLDLFYN